MNENLAFAAKLKTPGKINLKFYERNDVSLTLLVKTMLIDVLTAYNSCCSFSVNMKWNGRNAGAVSARFNKKGAKLSDLFLLL